MDPLPNEGRRTLLRALLGMLAVALLVGAGVASAVILEVKHDIQSFKKNHPVVDTPPGLLDKVDPGAPQTILVLGSDHRYGQGKGSQSDTMMLLRLDPDKGVTAMSIPRDLQVTIPGHGVDKINAAFREGGAVRSTKTVTDLFRTVDPSFGITHFVDVNFRGFRRIVNKLGCAYADVDRHYFNDNNPPNGGGGDYATIDVEAGYQKLCGQDALDYVRYRHFDTDIVRAARQQQFLSELRAQVGLGELWNDREALLGLAGRTTTTDDISDDGILQILKLAISASDHPIQQIKFPGDLGPSFVTVTPDNLARAVRRFEQVPSTLSKSVTKAKKRRKKRANASVVGLEDVAAQGKDAAIPLAVKARIPVAYPTMLANGSEYRTEDLRAYTLKDRNGNVRRAYRIPIQLGDPGQGQVYGIQGLAWKNPPILDGPHSVAHRDGRKLLLYADGRRLRLIAWRAHHVTYWLANTLSHDLTNRQMLGIAGATETLG